MAMGLATVEFRLARVDDVRVVEIIVDGTPLIELAREAERESATASGQPQLAGAYGALPWGGAPQLLFGKPRGHLDEEGEPGRVPLLVCGDCGIAGCWPLMAFVEVTADRVTWSDFHQPYRPDWSHRTLGPFTFDRAQYTAALDAARALGAHS